VKKRDKKTHVPPVDQAASPLNGIVPPPEYRWKKGQSGHPQGRPTAGASILEWLNVMAEWPLAKIAGVTTDPDAPAAKLMAARRLLDACSEDRASSGMPISGPDFDRIMDRTEGKPKQSMDVKMDASVSQKDATQAAMDKILSDPEAFAAAEALAARLLPDAIEPANS
jgi:hypothetical protein